MRIPTALILLPLLASAETGPATNYLMQEPATLLDIGMIRLDDLADEFENRVGLYWTDGEDFEWFKAEVNTSYDSDDDKIYVVFSVMSSEPNEAQMAEGCSNAMSQMNIWLLKNLPSMFQHVGSTDRPMPADFYPSLRDMFEIRCYFSSGRDSSEGRFWAHRKLTTPGDDEMTIGRWAMRN